MVYQFPRAAVTKHHKLGGLKQQKFIVSQFWRPEVQNEGDFQAMLPLKPLGEGIFWFLPAFGGPRHSLAVTAQFQWASSSHVFSHHLSSVHGRV